MTIETSRRREHLKFPYAGKIYGKEIFNMVGLTRQERFRRRVQIIQKMVRDSEIPLNVWIEALLQLSNLERDIRILE